MIISKLELVKFRNFNNVSLNFNKNLNIIMGDNAVGKSNILEAITYLSLAKSFKVKKEEELIKTGYDKFSIKASLRTENAFKDLEIKYDIFNKLFFINKTKINKVSEYVGNLPIIYFNPEDLEIINNSPSIRRQVLNIELCQISKKYFNYLSNYNKYLKIRNNYLKKTNNYNDMYFKIVTDKLVEYGSFLYLERKKFLNKINEEISQIYEDISGFSKLLVKYNNSGGFVLDEMDRIKERFLKKLESYKKRELEQKMTLIGPHRDDFNFNLNDFNISDFGSQGQKKMALISFKIAEIKIFKDTLDVLPILLLDDLFSDLDQKRRNKLLKYIDNDMQVIITCNDLRGIKTNIRSKAKIFKIQNERVEIKNG